MTDASTPPALDSVEVDPRNPLVELDLNQTGEQAFTATAHYRDGSSGDITDRVERLVANPNVGTLSGATLAIPAFGSAHAEVSSITARLSGVDGVARITVVAHASSGPAREPLLVLPYQDAAGAQDVGLDFATAIPALDVFFLMDTTGSMLGEITNLEASLTSTVIPGIAQAVSDSQFGVGALEDFPIDPYGNLHGSDCGKGGDATPDQPFKLRQAITSDETATQAAVNGLATGTGPIGCGGDFPEAGLEAIYQVATGEGLTSPVPTNVPANHTGIGGVGFRAAAMPVVVTVSDAESHGAGESGGSGS